MEVAITMGTATCCAFVAYCLGKAVKLQAIEDFYQAVRLAHSLVRAEYIEKARSGGKDVAEAWNEYPKVVAQVADEMLSKRTKAVMELVTDDYQEYLAAAVAMTRSE